MKKFIIIMSLLLTASLIFADNAPSPVTDTAQTGILEAIMNSFKPSPVMTPVSLTAKAVEEEKHFNTPGNLLILTDIMAVSLTTILWADYGISVSDYNRSYSEINNTTYDNYTYLKDKENEINSKLTPYLVTTGITAALLAYTAADVLWLHNAFPAEIKVSYGINKTIVTAILHY